MKASFHSRWRYPVMVAPKALLIRAACPSSFIVLFIEFVEN